MDDPNLIILMPSDSASQARLPELLRRLRAIAELDY